MNDIKEITEVLHQFRDERNWKSSQVCLLIFYVRKNDRHLLSLMHRGNLPIIKRVTASVPIKNHTASNPT